MLQRILMILLAFTLASAWAARADDWNVELVGKTPGAAYEVFILDNYAYLCAGSVLVILDISDPSNPTAVGQASLPDTGRGIHVSGGYAYVADESEGLRVIDITALSDPQEVGFYDTPVGFDQNLIYLPREPLREVKKMPVVKIGPKHQVTIPKEIFDELYLQAGDFLEAVAQYGKIIMIPKQLTNKAPAPSLTKKEQQALPQVKEKISKIQTDLVNSQGLDDDEVKLAAKVGLIDPEQAWWWREEWQKGEREAEKDVAQNETSGPFRSVNGIGKHEDVLGKP